MSGTSAHPLALLVDDLFNVDWNPFVEHRRYFTMEGHLELFNGNETDPDKVWKRLYFRTKDGRFQWFASHCADEHPISDVLLTGAEIKVNRDDWTILLEGGKENAELLVRVPSNVFEKWRQALINHASSSLVDAYIQPTWPPDPHRTNTLVDYNFPDAGAIRVLLLELSSHSIRAGILTQKPSLPKTMMPTICAVVNENDHLRYTAVGKDALLCDRNLRQFLIEDQAALVDRTIALMLFQKVKAEITIHAREMDIQFRPQDFLVLVSIPQHVDMTTASEILRLLLDSLIGFKKVAVVRQPSLVLYSYDVTTGIVVTLGEQFSIVPIIDEFVVDDAINISLPYGAKQIREYLRTKIDLQSAICALEADETFHDNAKELLLRFIVEKSCYVVEDGFEEERKKCTKEAKVVVPGTNLTISIAGESRFTAAEGLFDPSLWGMESVAALPCLINEAIQRCPIDSRRPLYRAIYLTGGCSMLRGLAERLAMEIAKYVPSSIPVQVLSSPWRRHSSFLGAHRIASAPDFSNLCYAEKELVDYIERVVTSEM